MRILALLLILWSTPASAAPWYCGILRSGISTYGDTEALKFAQKRGYTKNQYRQAKKECRIG